jgi:uncharacterized protein (DUF2235 family)
VGKKIILLSDGTGNSSAKIWRTNVWRLFSALDLSQSDQVAFYDDGVGTSSFKPLAILGGAFGIGLKRNVIEIYKFASRNYRNPTDEIFGFGFSRGAFTIRVVVGLILDQGLIDATNLNDGELDKLARLAYHAYHRRHFHTNWGRAWLALRSWLGSGKKAQPAAAAAGPRPIIRFLGVWDTVAAYGLPIDEMTRGVSQWIWPLEIPSHQLNPLVQRACHALSLDDERTTFHPVLWQEPANNGARRGSPPYTKDETVSQVWFAGVHANVGGGYPDDSLAYIPLYWIMEEARECGLRFKLPPSSDPNALAQVRSAQDKDGRLYNSRTGFSSYYRYGPRNVAKLCKQKFSWLGHDQVDIPCPKIHETVLDRIKNNAHVYSPLALPAHYEVVANRLVGPPNQQKMLFEILAPAANSYERPADAAARVNSEESQVAPLVIWRAALYFATVFASLVLVVFPFTGRPDPLNEISNPFRWVSDLIRLTGTVLPSLATRWVEGYAENPRTFLWFVFALALLIGLGAGAATKISNRMTDLWRLSLTHRIVNPGSATGFGYKLREVWLAPFLKIWKFGLAPALSAVGIIYLCAVLVSHAAFNILDVGGMTCSANGPAQSIAPKGVLVTFSVDELCHATGLTVVKGNNYLVWVDPSPTALQGDYPGYTSQTSSCPADQSTALQNGSIATTPAGYSTFHNDPGKELSPWETLVHFVLTPLRREWDRPWFQVVARYGQRGGEETFLDPDPDPRVTTISEIMDPPLTTELFLFVNDAVVGIPGVFNLFYKDNKGCLSVFIKPK